jgi:hypothetical protein
MIAPFRTEALDTKGVTPLFQRCPWRLASRTTTTNAMKAKKMTSCFIGLERVCAAPRKAFKAHPPSAQKARQRAPFRPPPSSPHRVLTAGWTLEGVVRAFQTDSTDDDGDGPES